MGVGLVEEALTPKPIATVAAAYLQNPNGSEIIGGVNVAGHLFAGVSAPEVVAGNINAAHFAATERLRGQLAAAREALVDVVDRHYSGRCLVKDGACDDPACCSEGRFRSVLASLDADEPHVRKALLDASEAKHLLRDQAEEEVHRKAYAAGFEAGRRSERQWREAT